MSKVISIEEIEKQEETYNLHIEDNHNYFANGMNVSNCHLAGGKSLTNLAKLAVNAEYRIGLSGSLPKREKSIDYFGIIGSFGKVLTISDYKTLQEQKRIANIKIFQVELQYPFHEAQEFLESKPDFERETQFLINHPRRTKLIAEKVLELEGNSAVLFTRIEHGKKMAEELKKKGLRENEDFFIVNGDVKTEKRQLIYDYFERAEGKILLASFGVFSTGINIKNLHNVAFLSNYKRYVKVLQSIGRSCRTHETKEFATILDFSDNLVFERIKSSNAKHMMERRKVYEERGLEYEIIKESV